MNPIDVPRLPSPIGRYRDVLKSQFDEAAVDHVPRWYERIAMRQVEERETARRAITEMDAWKSERERLRADFQAALGPFPPHEVEVVEKGRIDKPHLTVHKLLFSALPDHWVPANIYLPREAAGPCPGIVLPCGHGLFGKAGYAARAARLARNGYAAITFDFIGTGERPLTHPHRAPCPVSTQHNMQGAKLPLCGYTMGWFMLQETMAAVTALQRCPKVDPERIGITGSSGGGWTTVHAAALDPRLKVAVPAASVSSLRYEIKADDAEQVMFGMSRRGLHYPDLMAFLICPRPLFIVANSKDIWGIRGTRYAHDEAMRGYALHQAEDRLKMQVWDRGHCYQDDQLEVAIDWFNTWLKPQPHAPVNDDSTEADIPAMEELLVSPEENIFSDGYKRPNQVFADVRARRTATSRKPPEDMMASLRLALHREGPVEWLELDRFRHGTGFGRRIVYKSEPDLWLPAEMMEPEGAPRGIMILVDEGDRRKDVEWQVEWVSRGYTVVRPDVRGWGETSPREEWADWEGWAQNRYSDAGYRLFALARLTGRNLVWDRARDLTALLDILVKLAPNLDIALRGRRQGALPALYAALADERVKQLALENHLRSYRDLMDSDPPLWRSEGQVENILRDGYDIPDLLNLFPGTLTLKNPLDGRMRPVETAL